MLATPLENAFCNMLTVFSNPAAHVYFSNPADHVDEDGASQVNAIKAAYLNFMLQLKLNPFLDAHGELGGADVLLPGIENILVNRLSVETLNRFKEINFEEDGTVYPILTGAFGGESECMLVTFRAVLSIVTETSSPVDQFIISNDPAGNLITITQFILNSNNLTNRQKLALLSPVSTSLDHLETREQIRALQERVGIENILDSDRSDMDKLLLLPPVSTDPESAFLQCTAAMQEQIVMIRERVMAPMQAIFNSDALSSVQKLLSLPSIVTQPVSRLFSRCTEAIQEQIVATHAEVMQQIQAILDNNTYTNSEKLEHIVALSEEPQTLLSLCSPEIQEQVRGLVVPTSDSEVGSALGLAPLVAPTLPEPASSAPAEGPLSPAPFAGAALAAASAPAPAPAPTTAAVFAAEATADSGPSEPYDLPGEGSSNPTQ